ncbi:hypothetical protein G6F31_020220 [Rhizopus arrhizus]|nr:hypothetical protein G6F31_020220 [Rhizopus arrhizus]
MGRPGPCVRAGTRRAACFARPGPDGLLPPVRTAGKVVFVVGLPPVRLPSQRRPADRPRALVGPAGQALHRLRDRQGTPPQ